MDKDRQIEKMIETLKKISCVYTDCEQECSQCSNEELYYEALNHIARTIYEAGYRKQEWVSVYERLPDLEPNIIKWGDRGYKQNSVRVLCVCKQKSGKVMVKEGYYEVWDGNKTRPYWKIPGSIDSVTHWMPLPESPKGEHK